MVNAIDPVALRGQLDILGRVGQLEPSREIVPIPGAPGGDAPAFENVLTDSIRQAEGPGFGQSIESGLDKVNQLMLQSDKAIQDLVSGQSTNIHGTLMALQKADLSFRMLLEVRGKMMRAYEEVMRMQV